MRQIIRFSDGKEIDVIDIHGAKRNVRGAERDSLKIKIKSDYETAHKLFVDGAVFSIVDFDEIEVLTADGEPTGEYETVETAVYDKSEYSVAGKITDYRDGSCAVFMGAPTKEELAKAEAEAYKQMLLDSGANLKTIEAGAVDIGSLKLASVIAASRL